MNIYSKNGDKGTTNLVHTKNVSKSDDRVRLFGDLDELNSYLGLVKTMIDETDTLRMLEKVQMTLLMIMDGVADPFNREYKVDDDKTELLEEEISRLEELFSPQYGDASSGAVPSVGGDRCGKNCGTTCGESTGCS